MIRAIGIKDKKDPSKTILKITEPQELRGKIAFPFDFVPEVDKEYIVEIVKDFPRYCKVRLHVCKFEKVDEQTFRIEFSDMTLRKVIVKKCICGATQREEHIVSKASERLDLTKCLIDVEELERVIQRLGEAEIEKELQKIERWAEELWKKGYVKSYEYEKVIRYVSDLRESVNKLRRAESILKFIEDLGKDGEIIDKLAKAWEQYYRCRKCGSVFHESKAKTAEDVIPKRCLERKPIKATLFGEWYGSDADVCVSWEYETVVVRLCPHCDSDFMEKVTPLRPAAWSPSKRAYYYVCLDREVKYIYKKQHKIEILDCDYW